MFDYPWLIDNRAIVSILVGTFPSPLDIRKSVPWTMDIITGCQTKAHSIKSELDSQEKQETQVFPCESDTCLETHYLYQGLSRHQKKDFTPFLVGQKYLLISGTYLVQLI